MAFGKIPAYRRYELFMERYRAAAEFVQRELGSQGALRVLDVGSGKGRLKYFFDFCDHVEWHGVEVLDTMMAICTGLGYRMHRHDIEEAPLPFPDAEFDVVAGLHVLEHLARPEPAVRELLRVLRPGGLLLLGVPTKPPGAAGLIEGWHRLCKAVRGEAGLTCRAYTAGGFARFVRQAAGDAGDVLDVRGFRLFSARRRLPLEDWAWFYRASTRFGRCCPALTPEVNVIVRKRQADARRRSEPAVRQGRPVADGPSGRQNVGPRQASGGHDCLKGGPARAC